jgi:nucleoside 2-deoxyribosyltransferase
LSHPLAERQFEADLEALKQADICVLGLPCGRSAHTEAGWMAGAGKRVIAYIPAMVEPELMYKLFDRVVGKLDDLVQCLCYDGEVKE